LQLVPAVDAQQTKGKPRDKPKLSIGEYLFLEQLDTV